MGASLLEKGFFSLTIQGAPNLNFLSLVSELPRSTQLLRIVLV